MNALVWCHVVQTKYYIATSGIGTTGNTTVVPCQYILHRRIGIGTTVVRILAIRTGSKSVWQTFFFYLTSTASYVSSANTEYEHEGTLNKETFRCGLL